MSKKKNRKERKQKMEKRDEEKCTNKAKRKKK